MSKYKLLADELRRKITDKIYQAGNKLPSELELQEQFQVSRQTVRNALELLERQGLVRSRQGSGTYVVDREAEEQKKSRRIAVVTTYLEQDLRGLIIETTKSALPNPNLPLYRRLREKGIPVLFINSRYPELDCPVVCLQDEQAGRLAAECLLANGHKKIGGFFKRDDGQGVRRYRGFLEALRDGGIRPAEEHILWFDTEDALDFDGMEEQIVKRLGACTGIMCYNDSTASHVMEIWKRRGISVPEDMSIVSVDDTDLAMLGDVGLTSVHHPKEKLGEKAAKQLISMIRNQLPGTSYEFEPYLAERNSVKDLTE